MPKLICPQTIIASTVTTLFGLQSLRIYCVCMCFSVKPLSLFGRALKRIEGGRRRSGEEHLICCNKSVLYLDPALPFFPCSPFLKLTSSPELRVAAVDGAELSASYWASASISVKLSPEANANIDAFGSRKTFQQARSSAYSPPNHTCACLKVTPTWGEIFWVFGLIPVKNMPTKRCQKLFKWVDHYYYYYYFFLWNLFWATFLPE